MRFGFQIINLLWHIGNFVPVQLFKKIMLYTNLNHIVCAQEFETIMGAHENVMVICGRMDPESIRQYRIAEELERVYKAIKFYDIEFDDPNLFFLHAVAEVEELREIPYILYFRYGQVVKATSGNQTKAQVINILENEFAIPVSP